MWTLRTLGVQWVFQFCALHPNIVSHRCHEEYHCTSKWHETEKKKLKIALWTVSKTEGVSGSCGQPITIFFSSSPSFCSCLPPSAPADFAGDSAPFLEEIYLCLLLNSAAAAQTFPYHCVAMQSWFYQKSGVRLPWTRKSSTLIRKEGWLAGRQHDWLSLVSLGTQAEKVRK